MVMGIERKTAQHVLFNISCAIHQTPWQTYLATWWFQRWDADLEQKFIHWMLSFWSSDMHPTKSCARIDFTCILPLSYLCFA